MDKAIKMDDLQLNHSQLSEDTVKISYKKSNNGVGMYGNTKYNGDTTMTAGVRVTLKRKAEKWYPSQQPSEA